MSTTLFYRYEGTGRSLSLKLIEQLRSQSATATAAKSGSRGSTSTTTTTSGGTTSSRMLVELSLNESIRYATGDPVEKWLNDLLCLDASVVSRISSGCPLPGDCDLYLFFMTVLKDHNKALA